MVEQTQRSHASFQAVRRAIPYALTVAVAGLGHLYCRQWRRGVAWLGLFAFTLVVLSAFTLDSSGMFFMSVLGGELSPFDVAFPGAIILLALLDLYLFQRFDIGEHEPDADAA